ncbi:hypothetical protein E6O75_ATG09699 [Venturia nashicola]|uniref:Uncharacterized protein n=1 Tax=Venturia nashicola TaxID=86259 RepID=A0A4Z1NMK1_9PEZI|nr:hypothetical protein E6O75_ATG09699 [Venturia nashicola]
MVPSSQTITSYKGNQAAMLGWKLDTTRQVWYRTTVFWDVDDQRLPETPPRHLRKDFVPGQRCPRGEREKFPLIKPRNFVNPIFKDNPTGVSPSFDGSSSSTGSSRTIFHGNHYTMFYLDKINHPSIFSTPRVRYLRIKKKRSAPSNPSFTTKLGNNFTKRNIK